MAYVELEQNLPSFVGAAALPAALQQPEEVRRGLDALRKHKRTHQHTSMLFG